MIIRSDPLFFLCSISLINELLNGVSTPCTHPRAHTHVQLFMFYLSWLGVHPQQAITHVLAKSPMVYIYIYIFFFFFLI